MTAYPFAKFFRLIATFIALSMFVPQSSAQTCDLYVNASDGSDDNQGLLASPLKSLPEAWKRIGDQQKLCVAAGDYFDSQTDELHLTGKNDIAIVLKAFGGRSDIILDFGQVILEGNVSLEVSTNEHITLTQIEKLPPRPAHIAVVSGEWDFGSVPVYISDSVTTFLLQNGTIGGSRIEFSPNTKLYYSNDVEIKHQTFLPAQHIIFNNSGTTYFTNPVSFQEPNVLISGDGDIIFKETVSFQSPAFAFDATENANSNLFFESKIILKGDEQPYKISAHEIYFGEIDAVESNSETSLELELRSSSVTIGLINELAASRLSIDAQDAYVSLIHVDPYRFSPRVLKTGGILNFSGTLIVEESALSAAIIRGHDVSRDAIILRKDGLIDAGLIDSSTTILQNDALLGNVDFIQKLRVEGSAKIATQVIIDNMVVQEGSILRVENNLHLKQIEVFGTLIQGGTHSYISVSGIFSTGETASLQVSNILLENSFSHGSFLGGCNYAPNVITSEAYFGHVTIDCALTQLVILNGSLNVDGIDNRINLRSVALSSGKLITKTSTMIISEAFSISRSALFDHTADLELIMSGTLEWNSDDQKFLTTAINVEPGKDLKIVIGSRLEVPNVYVSHPSSSVSIEGNLAIVQDLELAKGKFVIESQSSLELYSNLRRIDGSFIPIDDGNIVFSSDRPQEIVGFSSTILPSLIISGSVFFRDDVIRILGDLLIEGGSVHFTRSGILEIQNDLTLSSGKLIAQERMQVFTRGNLSVTSGSVEMTDLDLTLNGQAHFIASEVFTPFNNLSWNGVLEIGDRIRARSLTPIGNRLEPSVLHTQPKGSLHVSELFVIGKDKAVELRGSTVVHVSGRVQSDGYIIGSGGIIMVSSGILAGEVFPPKLIIDAADLDDVVTVEISEPRVSEIFFLRGRLSFSEDTIHFLPESVVSIDVSDYQTRQGDIDEYFINVNQFDGDPSVVVSGTIDDFVQLPFLSKTSGVHNLTLRTRDSLNEPDVYGLILPDSLTISGSLTVDSGSSLNGNSLALIGFAAEHQIRGTLNLSGRLNIEGESFVFTTATGSAISADVIVSSGGSFEGPSTFNSLDLQNATVTFTGTEEEILTIRGTFTSSQSEVDISGVIFVLQSGRMISNDDAYRFSAGGRFLFPNGGSIDINSSRILNHNVNGSVLDLFGRIDLKSNVNLPNIAFNKDSVITFVEDLTITDTLLLDAAKLILAGNTLRIMNAVLTLNGGTIDGMSEVGYSNLIVSGASRIEVANSPVVNFVSFLTIDAIVEFSAAITTSKACRVVFASGKVAFENSNVQLGSCDISVLSSREDALSISGSSIDGNLVYLDNSESSIPVIAELINDLQTGSLMLATGNTAGIVLNGHNEVSVLTLSGNWFFSGTETSNSSLTIDKYFDVTNSSSRRLQINPTATISILPDAFLSKDISISILGNLVFPGSCNLLYRQDATDPRSSYDSSAELCDAVNRLTIDISLPTRSTTLNMRHRISISERLDIRSGVLSSRDHIVEFKEDSSVNLFYGSSVNGDPLQFNSSGQIGEVNIFTFVSTNISVPLLNTSRLVMTALGRESEVSIYGDLVSPSIFLNATDKAVFKLRTGNILADSLFIKKISLQNESSIAKIEIADVLELDSESELIGNFSLFVQRGVVIDGTVEIQDFKSCGDMSIGTNANFSVSLLDVCGGSNSWLLSQTPLINNLVINLDENAELTLKSSTPEVFFVTPTTSLQLLSGTIHSDQIGLNLPDDFIYEEPGSLDLPVKVISPSNVVPKFSLPLAILGSTHEFSFEGRSMVPVDVEFILSPIEDQSVPLSNLARLSETENIFLDPSSLWHLRSSRGLSSSFKYNLRFTDGGPGNSFFLFKDNSWRLVAEPSLSKLDNLGLLIGLSGDNTQQNEVVPVTLFNHSASDLQFVTPFQSVEFPKHSASELSFTPGILDYNFGSISERLHLSSNLRNLACFSGITTLEWTLLPIEIPFVYFCNADQEHDSLVSIMNGIIPVTSANIAPGESVAFEILQNLFTIGITTDGILTSYHLENPGIFLAVGLNSIIGDYFISDHGSYLTPSINTGVTEPSLGVELSSQPQIYPRPFTNSVTIEAKSDDLIAQVAVFNALGARVLHQDFGDNGSNKVNVYFSSSQLSSGLYLFKVKLLTGKIFNLVNLKGAR